MTSEPCAPEQRPAIFDILRERNRQIEKGYTVEHDEALPSAHPLVSGAMAYLCSGFGWPGELGGREPDRRGSYREAVVRAAAMLVAEIERMDAEALAAPKPKERDAGEVVEALNAMILAHGDYQPGNALRTENVVTKAIAVLAKWKDAP